LFEVSEGQPTRTKDKEMTTYIYESLRTFTNDQLTALLENELLHSLADVAARRILKDRLEGLDEMVRVENLKDKIASA
jgi:hypothetical protein